jgi:hypothetical protein
MANSRRLLARPTLLRHGRPEGAVTVDSSLPEEYFTQNLNVRHGLLRPSYSSLASFCQVVVDLTDRSKTLGQEVDEILGMSVLKEFEIVSVDIKRHKLILKYVAGPIGTG